VADADLKPAGAEEPSSRHFFWLGLGVVALVFVVATALTWRKWPDILVDFGVQLYVPWQILHGAVLYRDLFYMAGGPFSQYFNALLFKIFGVSFFTLIVTNLILAAAMIFIVYRNFCEASDVLTATIIGAGIVVAFAFAQYTLIGNYNYIAPYSHEAVHGLALSIFAITLLCHWITRERILPATAAGFCAGLVFLTKPDIFIGLAVTTAAACILFYLKSGARKLGLSAAAFFAAAIVPSLFFLLYFSRVESWRESIRSIFFGWLPLFYGVTKNPFYRSYTGMDLPLVHVETIVGGFLAIVFVLALYAFVLRWVQNAAWAKSKYITALLFMVPLLIWAVKFDWVRCGWPLPLLCLSSCILIAWNYKRMERPPIFAFLWSVLALLLLAKLGLLPRIWHYGFALAMPAFASSVYLLFWLLPKLLEKHQVPVGLFRMMIGLVLVIGLGNLFDQSQMVYAQKTATVGSGGDGIVTYNATADKTKAVRAALLWAEKNMPTNATLAVLPEGVMLNYLTRHPNSTPCLDWNPTMLSVFGETTMTDALETHPPDYIFIVDWDSSDFGVGYFGSSADYGLGLMQWIQKNYQAEVLIGSEPLKNGLFGIKILKRLPAAQVQAGGVNQPRSVPIKTYRDPRLLL
jgi:hypothetical protein